MMSAVAERESATFRLPFYYGWVNVIFAAVAMTATLPGRTHGLGLITEPLLDDLRLDPVRYSGFNLFATLIGGGFCLLVGPLIDRWGTRRVLAGVALLLGGSVCAMSCVTGEAGLLVTLTLIRGFGQSALSVVSMAMVGKWFRRRVGTAMGLFTVLMAIGFIVTTLGVGNAVKAHDWRIVWNAVGLCVLGLAPLGLLLVRSRPTHAELIRCRREDEFDSVPATTDAGSQPLGELTLGKALRQPLFWTLAAGTCMFNVTWSATTLFYESILDERGFGENYVHAMAAMTAAGLVTNLAAGWAATKCSMNRVLSVGLFVFAPMLFLYPRLSTPSAAIWQAGGMGIAGGIITIVFFSAWGRVFGRTHLGRIQGTAQLLSVFASACGPLLLTSTRRWTGSYATFFQSAAAIVLVLAVWAWFMRSSLTENRFDDDDNDDVTVAGGTTDATLAGDAPPDHSQSKEPYHA